MHLIIVESPTKAKTITKFLDKNYKIESSFGHIRDLPKSKMGIDIENDFSINYEIPAKAEKIITNLKKIARKAATIILASDEDREGEAIAWHLQKALKLDEDKTQRIVFHEITKNAILEALEKPRQIDMNLVDAQQARRVLDRLVGYKLSPFLWKKVSYGLSAGRVQSVAMRLIVEREREIQAFKAQEYWSIEAELSQKEKSENKIQAKLNKIKGKTIDKFAIKNETQAQEILENLENKKYLISNITKKESRKTAPKPFTTSTLQQTANRWLGFSAKQTMMLAQQLYEGAGTGSGLITYMRTDSLNLSQKFQDDAKKYLKENLGDKYTIDKAKIFKNKSKNAQEAHEAIRPTEANNTPDKLEAKLNKNQFKLYQLIWQRSLATQMTDAILDSTVIDIQAKNTDYEFRANGQIIKFPGYLKIYPEKSKEIELPEVNEKEELNLEKITPEQHFTKPPARYSDAGLVKKLEEYGIGRPSTYAPTISTIEARNYARRDDNKKLEPTEISFIVNDLLVAHFPDIVSYKFTAKMEDDLDRIAAGKNQWRSIVKDFYEPFHENLKIKEEQVQKKDVMPEEKSDEVCDECGSEMIVKTGRFGKFLTCSRYPECKFKKNFGPQGKVQEKSEETKKLEEKYKNEVCEKCGAQMTLKTGRFGPFLGCSAYPKCKNIRNIAENNPSTGVKCPKCGKGEIVEKKSRRGIFYACNKYPDCKNAYWGKPTGDKCLKCDGLILETKDGKKKCGTKGCGG